MPCCNCGSSSDECFPQDWKSLQKWRKEFDNLRQQWSDYTLCGSSMTTECCQCCKHECPPRMVKGRFGLAWISETPKRKCCAPCGWQLEICDTPSNVERHCKTIENWANCPPIDECTKLKDCCEQKCCPVNEGCPKPKECCQQRCPVNEGCPKPKEYCQQRCCPVNDGCTKPKECCQQRCCPVNKPPCCAIKVMPFIPKKQEECCCCNCNQKCPSNDKAVATDQHESKSSTKDEATSVPESDNTDKSSVAPPVDNTTVERGNRRTTRRRRR